MHNARAMPSLNSHCCSSTSSSLQVESNAVGPDHTSTGLSSGQVDTNTHYTRTSVRVAPMGDSVASVVSVSNSSDKGRNSLADAGAGKVKRVVLTTISNRRTTKVG